MVIVVTVLLLHVFALWALQTGLLVRALEIVVPAELLASLPEIRAPTPPEVPPANRLPPRQVITQPVTQPVIQSAPEVPVTPSPPQPALALPAAIADTTPSANAPHGAGVPAVAAAPPAPNAATQVVELPSSDASYLHNPKPVYPAASQRRGEHGTVLLNVQVAADGSPLQVEVKVSSGYSRLDQTALDTARTWRFVPGKRGGVAQVMWVTVPMSFVLE